MNQHIEKYIEERKREISRQKENEKMQLLLKLGLVEKDYYTQIGDQKKEDYPFYDPKKIMYYKLIYKEGVEEITDEEYSELLKYVPQEEEQNTIDNSMSGWYYFSIFMMILGIVGGIALGIVFESFVYLITVILYVLIFFTQTFLLCKIEKNTRSNK